MGKRQGSGQGSDDHPSARRPSNESLSMVTLGGVILLLMISFANWRDVDRIDKSLTDTLGKLETRLAQVAEKIEKLPAQGAAHQGPDPSRVYAINMGNAPFRGPAAAPVTVAEFSDFQWPFCSRVGSTLTQIERAYGDKVRIVWKHFPLDMHQNAMGAHIAALAAGKQGKFWEYHDKLFANQSKLSVEDLKRYARELKLNMDQFEKDLGDLEIKKQIEADKAEAQRMGLTGTPGFFINGHFLNGAKPVGEFAKLINAELTRQNVPIPAGAPAG